MDVASYEPAFRWAYGLDLDAMLDMDSERYELHKEFADWLMQTQAGGGFGGQ